MRDDGGGNALFLHCVAVAGCVGAVTAVLHTTTHACTTYHMVTPLLCSRHCCHCGSSAKPLLHRSPYLRTSQQPSSCCVEPMSCCLCRCELVLTQLRRQAMLAEAGQLRLQQAGDNGDTTAAAAAADLACFVGRDDTSVAASLSALDKQVGW